MHRCVLGKVMRFKWVMKYNFNTFIAIKNKLVFKKNFFETNFRFLHWKIFAFFSRYLSQSCQFFKNSFESTTRCRLCGCNDNVKNPSSSAASAVRSPAFGRPRHLRERSFTRKRSGWRKIGLDCPSQTRLRRSGARVENQARSVLISRANPLSKATDRFCLLSLSALFDIGQRLLASKTCCGRLVRSCTRFNCTCPDILGTAGR